MISVLLCGLASEFAGFSPAVGTFFLGLALPDGPPLGAALVHKLDYLITVFFMPLNIGMVGMRTDIRQVRRKFLWRAVITMIFCFIGKIVGIMFAGVRYFGVSRKDGFLLGLIVNLKGIVEIIMLNCWVEDKVTDLGMNTVIVLAFVVIAAVVTPLVNYLYDPSLKFLADKRRNMVSRSNSLGLHVLVCVHTQDDVPAIITLLEALNPTKIYPLKVSILHLIELVGRSSSLLTAHPLRERSSTAKPNETDRIISAFEKLQQWNHKVVTIEPYSTTSPYASMHNDICTMSVDKKTSLVIFPFHPQDTTSLRNDLGRPAISNRNIKILFQNLLGISPCKVGILIEGNNHQAKITSISPDMPFNVTVLFFGGPDDRAALSFATNMIHHPCVFVTVIRFLLPTSSSSSESIDYNIGQKLLDDKLIDYFKRKILIL
ncbi:cation/H(+) antiporter 15-like [Papaver somniferum]|uniref:cation/H(+) antiporter 15-like n=1 Tax=Papaver somniferum TaxID=3469 RepID=UPI000E7034A8|nr:cation/H(+) antiporter 15-like [Papaver somniferum]